MAWGGSRRVAWEVAPFTVVGRWPGAGAHVIAGLEGWLDHTGPLRLTVGVGVGAGVDTRWW